MSTRTQTLDAHLVRPAALPFLPVRGDVSTQSIDLDSLFTADVNATGIFDLSGIESTSLGKLLNLLPIPAMLVDSWYSVVFANQACAKFGAGYKSAESSSFPDLFSIPRDPDRAKAVRERVLGLLERALSTRRPEVAEAILEVEDVRLWARLHLRSVKIASQRYVLTLIEDVTAEKTQSKLSEKSERRLREIHDKVAGEAHDLRTKLQHAEDQLRKMTKLYAESQEQLRLMGSTTSQVVA
jgi:hypothetical protein